MKNKITYITMAILPLTLCLILCIVNYTVAKQNVYGIPFVTHKAVELQDITKYSGFGVTISVLDQKGTEDIVKDNTKFYNEDAGVIDNWHGEMTFDQYEVYKNDLVYVNGDIVDSTITDDYVIYKFNNNNELTVYLKKSAEDLDKYTHSEKSASLVEETKDASGNTVYKYDNGVVKVENKQVVKGVEPLKIKMNYGLDVLNLVIHYVVVLGIEVIIYLLIKTFKSDEQKHSENEEEQIA